MAKKSIFDYDKWERKHVSRMGARARAVKKLFDELAQQASLLGVDVKLPSDKDFEFKNYPALEKRVDELVREVSKKVTRIIEDGEEEAWIEANAKNDALVDSVVKGSGLPKEVVAQWKQPNLSALAAFQARKIAGMGLSQRVWKLTQTAKQELELALDLGIGEGKSAAELSRDIRRYLNEPNKLFRRVRDEKGILRLSKAAKMYHPGRGVYRSSYKNALRLTQTEINMAYRSSDHERWSQTDWVIGVRVSLSNNHTLNGLPFHDICDDVQGVYPKDFKFVGWHPKCRCHATPELAKREERIAYLKKMANGEDVSGYKFSGQTKEVPQGFKDWVDKNAERIKGAEERGKLPYFLRDNGKFLTHDKEGLMSVAPQVKTPFDIARERHAMRTPEQAKAIQDRWDAKLAQDNLTKKTANNALNVAKEYPEVDIATLQQYIDTRNLKAMKEEARNVAKQVSAVKKDERFLEQLIPDVHEWKKQFTSAELHAVYDAVEKKLSQFSSLSLQEQAKKLDFEIKYVAAPSFFKPGAVQYPTWKVSQVAYVKQHAKVLESIEWENINKLLQDAIEFDTKSKLYKELVVKLQNAVVAKDKKKAQTIIAHINSKQSELNKAAAYRAKKKHQDVDGSIVFDDDCFTISRKGKANFSLDKYEGENYYFDNAVETYRVATREMKEAAEAYTRSSGSMTKMLRGADGFFERELSYAEKSTKEIEALTNMIKGKTFPADVWITRDERLAFTVMKAGGFDIASLEQKIIEFEQKVKARYRTKYGDHLTAKQKEKQDEIIEWYKKKQEQKLIGCQGVDNSFLSCSSNKSSTFSGTGGDNKFGNPKTRLEIYCPKGTQGVYAAPFNYYNAKSIGNDGFWDGKSRTKVIHEAEIILQRGGKYRILEARYDIVEDRWYIKCELLSQILTEIDGFECIAGQGFRTKFK